MDWPPRVEKLEEIEQPNLDLYRFLTWLKDPSVNKFETVCQDPEITTISSLLFSYITGKRTPLKVLISMAIHDLTRSREIVVMMKKLSLGISYNDVLNYLYATWA